MKSIIKKSSITNEQKLSDLLKHTELNGECMEWKGCLNTDGYARMGGNVKVHRLVKELETNENITGYVIRHSCDNPICINPKHLLKGTFAENNKDRFIRNRSYRVVTKEDVFKTRALINLNLFTLRQISKIVGIDERRVSDIKRFKYDDQGKFVGH